MDTLIGVLDVIGLIAWLLVIPVCFLKGRRGFAWFGIFMFGTGAALTIPGSRYLRQGLIDDWWWWLHVAQGVAVLVLMVAVALDPASPGSWWSRHREGGRQPGEASSSSILS